MLRSGNELLDKIDVFHNQAIHRLQRFLQTKPVRIDLIYTEAEREVRQALEKKWRQHEELVANMTGIIREGAEGLRRG